MTDVCSLQDEVQNLFWLATDCDGGLFQVTGVTVLSMELIISDPNSIT